MTPPTIAYLGPAGSFSEAGARTAFPHGELQTYNSIPACLIAAEKEEVAYCVIPIENTIEGTVNTSIDFLYHQSHLQVMGEILLPIAQQLLIHPDNHYKTIEKILSHPQALAQCADFIQKYYPDAILEQMPSTAYAAQLIAQHPQENWAALAPKTAAVTYDLEIVRADVQDLALNETRFWIVGREPLSEKIGKEKLTIAFTMPNNLPGALHKALSVFSWRSIDLSRIESRPLKTVLGEYFFVLDILVEQPIQLIWQALAELELLGGQWRLLGHYYSHGG